MAGVSQRSPRLKWALALSLGMFVLVAVVAFFRLSGSSVAAEEGLASSCEERTWPATEISCIAARNTSVTALSTAPGRWTVRIWLTTLDAVDARFHPRRQVADHPTSGSAPVWLSIYENTAGPGTGDRVLHVAAASNARPGAFVYVYQWPELGSPAVPATMPSIR